MLNWGTHVWYMSYDYQEMGREKSREATIELALDYTRIVDEHKTII